MIVDVLIELFSGIISSLTGFSDSFIELFFRKKQILKDEKKSKEALSKKLEKLTSNLHETSMLMAEIESEFQQQKELAEKWSKEAETSQIIASLSEKEVEAVTCEDIMKCAKELYNEKNYVVSVCGDLENFDRIKNAF